LPKALRQKDGIMADLKTIPSRVSVDTFLKGITDDSKRADCYQILEIMRKATKAEPKMWGTSIIGFGKYHSMYPSGREGDWFLTGFSPRKQNLTLYMNGGFVEFEDLLKQLGKHSTGKGCLYINKLEDVDLKVLKRLIKKSVKIATKNGT
jgi:hypothetical protein